MTCYNFVLPAHGDFVKELNPHSANGDPNLQTGMSRPRTPAFLLQMQDKKEPLPVPVQTNHAVPRPFPLSPPR